MVQPTDKADSVPPDYLFPIVRSAIYILAFFAICYCIKQSALNLKKIIIIAAINGVLKKS